MKHLFLHQKALRAARNLRRAEAVMIHALQELDACDGYNELGYTSLSSYMIAELKFSEANAHHYITVCRKAKKVPALQAALDRGKITISKAKTIAPVLNQENAPHWLGRAEHCTVRELEREVAQERPDLARVERIWHRAKDHVEVTTTLRENTHDILKRCQELMKQSKNGHVPFAEVLHELAEAYLERHDPLRKAERKDPEKRTEREKALLRDNGACQYVMPSGRPCGARYWIDLHHIKPRSEGGSDSAENLIVFCSQHHRMAHGPPSLT